LQGSHAASQPPGVSIPGRSDTCLPRLPGRHHLLVFAFCLSALTATCSELGTWCPCACSARHSVDSATIECSCPVEVKTRGFSFSKYYRCFGTACVTADGGYLILPYHNSPLLLVLHRRRGVNALYNAGILIVDKWLNLYMRYTRCARPWLVQPCRTRYDRRLASGVGDGYTGCRHHRNPQLLSVPVRQSQHEAIS
jgi:hypothetical protein